MLAPGYCYRDPSYWYCSFPFGIKQMILTHLVTVYIIWTMLRTILGQYLHLGLMYHNSRLTESGWNHQHSKKDTFWCWCRNHSAFFHHERTVALSQNAVGLKARPSDAKGLEASSLRFHDNNCEQKVIYWHYNKTWRVQGFAFFPPLNSHHRKRDCSVFSIRWGFRRPVYEYDEYKCEYDLSPPVAVCDLKAAGWNPAALLCLLIHLPIITRPQEAPGKWGN